jgi:hypothetical protein
MVHTGNTELIAEYATVGTTLVMNKIGNYQHDCIINDIPQT